MRLQLRPGLRQAWRRPGRLQIGMDPRHGLVLDGLTAGDEALLAALSVGTTSPALQEVAARAGVPEERTRALLAELRAGGVMVESPTVRSQLARLPDPLRARLAGDATVLGLAHPDGDGWDVLAARRSRCVAVAGAGRTGLAVSLGLAAAGVGQVLVRDPAPVGPGDVIPGGYRPQDVGRPRERAAAEALDRLGVQVHAPTAGAAAPDLVVLVSHGPLHPASTDPLLRDDVPHLVLTWGERDVAVGPLVVPGATSCVRCQHLHRADRDPEWPRVAAQLAARSPTARAAPEETTLAALAAALATAQVLAHLDAGAVPVVLDAALEVSLPDGGVARRGWPPHRACGCLRLPGVAPDLSAGTMVG